MDKLKLIEAILEASCDSSTKQEDIDLGLQIGILERGWVVVGKVRQRGQYLTFTNCSVVRRWGTTKGLGELARNGPLESTKLDPCPDVRVHELRVVAFIECEDSKWN